MNSWFIGALIIIVIVGALIAIWIDIDGPWDRD